MGNVTLTHERAHGPATQRPSIDPARRPGRLATPARVNPAESIGRVITYSEDDAFSAMDSFLLARFLDGEQPFARGRRLDRVREDATLLPLNASPIRSAADDGRTAQLAEGVGWTLRTLRWSSGGGYVEVVAATDELARTMLEQATDGAEEELADDDPRVEIGFWHLAGHGARRRELPIAAQPWVEIRTNYAAAAAAAFDQLVALDGSALSGRMLLVHGPPGTGKTTALRALAKEWRSWCQLDFVVDPERLFANPGYLIEVIMGSNDDKPWRLLLLEDCDELIRPGAKASAGQALSRLLNLTDGLLGQGRQVLVAITTNEDITRLHPAVIRPGRCLAQIEVGALSHAEATAWLAAAGTASGKGIAAGGATLAELIAMRDGTMPVGTPQRDDCAGMYL
jgi:hypothetical protein